MKKHIPIKINHDGVAKHKRNIIKDENPSLADNFNQQFMHENYSVESIENDYKNRVFPTQREGWKHGSVSNRYRNGYDQIRWDN